MLNFQLSQFISCHKNGYYESLFKSTFLLLFFFQVEFAEMIKDAGFSHVTYENLNFGIAAIHSGFKI